MVTIDTAEFVEAGAIPEMRPIHPDDQRGESSASIERSQGTDTLGSIQCSDELIVDAMPTISSAHSEWPGQGRDTLLSVSGEDSSNGAWNEVFVRDVRARQHLLKFAWDESIVGGIGDDSLFGSGANDNDTERPSRPAHEIGRRIEQESGQR